MYEPFDPKEPVVPSIFNLVLVMVLEKASPFVLYVPREQMLDVMLTLKSLTRSWSFLFVKSRAHPENEEIILLIENKPLLETYFETPVAVSLQRTPTSRRQYQNVMLNTPNTNKQTNL